MTDKLTDTKIQTNRLYLRPFVEDDAEDVYKFNSDDRVLKYLPGDLRLNSIEDARLLIKSVWVYEYSKYGYSRYAIELKHNHRVIGFCGIKYEPFFNAPDLGYRLLPEFWNKGIASEAVFATLQYAKDQLRLKRIVAAAAEDNRASIRILEKFGFKFRKHFEADGMMHRLCESYL